MAEKGKVWVMMAVMAKWIGTFWHTVFYVTTDMPPHGQRQAAVNLERLTNLLRNCESIHGRKSQDVIVGD
jgi:hypothetical protein